MTKYWIIIIITLLFYNTLQGQKTTQSTCSVLGTNEIRPENYDGSQKRKTRQWEPRIE